MEYLLLKNNLVYIGDFENGFEAFLREEKCAQNHAAIIKNVNLLKSLGASSLVVGTDEPKEPANAEATIEQLAQKFAKVATPIG